MWFPNPGQHDQPNVGQYFNESKCVVGHGLWDKHGYLHGFCLVMQYKNTVNADFYSHVNFLFLEGGLKALF